MSSKRAEVSTSCRQFSFKKLQSLFLGADLKTCEWSKQTLTERPFTDNYWRWAISDYPINFDGSQRPIIASAPHQASLIEGSSPINFKLFFTCFKPPHRPLQSPQEIKFFIRLIKSKWKPSIFGDSTLARRKHWKSVVSWTLWTSLAVLVWRQHQNSAWIERHPKCPCKTDHKNHFYGNFIQNCNRFLRFIASQWRAQCGNHGVTRLEYHSG